MAAPIHCDTSGYAGVSTFERDMRVQNAGKRVRGMQNPLHDSSFCTTAGLPTQKLAQVAQSTPKRQKTTLVPEEKEVDVTGTRLRTKKSYAAEGDYRNVFDTRWRADEKGRMALFLSRKPGHAHIETNPDKMDMISTFHRERALGQLGIAWSPDNLCNDTFLTGTLTANTLDVLKPVGNRAPPYADPNGPFETSPVDHPAKIDHLDGKCIPRKDTPHIAEGDERGISEGKSRMRVLRERSHIQPRGGQLVGNNRPPQLADIDDDEQGTKISYKRVAVSAPWTRGSFGKEDF